jgi:hypothetical protein
MGWESNFVYIRFPDHGTTQVTELGEIKAKYNFFNTKRSVHRESQINYCANVITIGGQISAKLKNYDML